jgi:hypothetical protein
MIAARIVAVALATLSIAACPVQAQVHHGGMHGGHFHHHHPGLFWGGVGIGVGIGFVDGYYYGPPYYPYSPYYYGPPGYVVAAPPVAYVTPAPVSTAPDPIFYPRSGQSAAQTEADRRDCNSWATTQANAMADASVFHRATMACMEGRGYSAR